MVKLLVDEEATKKSLINYSLMLAEDPNKPLPFDQCLNDNDHVMGRLEYTLQPILLYYNDCSAGIMGYDLI